MVRWASVCSLLGAFVLIPFVLLEAPLTAWFAATLAAMADRPLLAGAAIALILLADILLPVPSSLVGGFAGAALGFWGGALAIWLGLSAGCLAGYALGRFGGQGVLRALVGAEEVARARAALAGAGGVALVVTRALPVLAESMVLGAGAARMAFAPFLLLTGLANLAVALAYAALGALALAAGSFLLLFLGLAALPALGWLLWTRIRP